MGYTSTRAALNNLEERGYIIRRQLYDKRGRFAKCEYTVYERPQQASPPTDLPSSEKPTTENPSSKNASSVKPTLLNTNEEITEGSNTDSMNHPSINLDNHDCVMVIRELRLKAPSHVKVKPQSGRKP